MFLPTGGGGKAIDADDVSMIVPRLVGGLVYATCWLAGGISIPVDALPAALAAEVNALAPGLPLLLGPLVVSNFSSPVYVGGAHVQRVDPTASGLGSVWRFANTTSALIAPATTVAQAIVLINATGGGGGTGQGYTDRGVWTPTLTDPNETTVWDAPFVPAPWVRIGPADADGPAVGDYVTCGLVTSFSGEVVGDQPILVVSGFPFPPADAGAFSCAAMLIVDTQPGVSIGLASPPFGGSLFFQMQGVSVGPFAGLLSLEVTFQVDAS